jgi:hypothetical protein
MELEQWHLLWGYPEFFDKDLSPMSARSGSSATR